MRIIYGVQGEEWVIKERRDKERDWGLMLLLPNFYERFSRAGVRQIHTPLIKCLNEVVGLLPSNHLELNDN